MRVLLIGASGFLGTHLANELLARGHAVEGWCRRPRQDDARIEWRAVDLSDPASLRERRGPWDAAYLLAGHSVPGRAFSIALAMENVGMTAAAIEHLCRVSPGARAVLLSSGLVYAADPRPRTETDAVDPPHDYGRSKLLCEAWARARSRALDVQIVRSFNQIGPGMPAGLLLPDLLAALESHGTEIRMHGSDDARDFLDVRDGARALALLSDVDAPSGSVWNLCSGRATRVSELVRAVMRRTGRDRALAFDGDRSDVRVGSPEKIAHATGWSPRHALEDTIDFVVRERAAHEIP